ncbi:MAG: tRNA (guanosine(46)-N7)-methyltransferase TrmB [Sphingomonadales bacterium]
MTAPQGFDADAPPKFYGRRKGHPLRARAEMLVADLLPAVAVAGPPTDGLDPAALFAGAVDEVWLEIGFGKGEHLAEQAKANPRAGIIGAEPFLNGVAGLLDEIDSRNLGNVRIFAEDVRRLLPTLPDASIGRVFLLFPDPWPKKRHHKRRFIQPDNLDELARVLKDGAEFRFATDHMGYAGWGLRHMMNHAAFEWLAERPADWRNQPVDWHPTRYETKALEDGKSCAYLRFRRRHRP